MLNYTYTVFLKKMKLPKFIINFIYDKEGNKDSEKNFNKDLVSTPAKSKITGIHEFDTLFVFKEVNK